MKTRRLNVSTLVLVSFLTLLGLIVVLDISSRQQDLKNGRSQTGDAGNDWGHQLSVARNLQIYDSLAEEKVLNGER